VIEFVEGGVFKREGVPDLVDLAFDLHGVWCEESAVWQVRVGVAVDHRDDRLHPFGVEVDGGSAVGHIGHDFQAGPEPGGTAHGNRVATQIKRLGGITRVEHGNVHVGQGRRGR